jgi:hypothetical protein
MDVRGYNTGSIDAAGAFTSEIGLPQEVTPGLLSTVVEADRPSVVHMPGMRHKYLPMRYDPADGALAAGGRYLFHGYEDACRFRDFLETCTMDGEETTFWKRPWFIDPVRFAWRVFGAFDLAPITTHEVNRFEWYAVPDGAAEARLPDTFETLLKRARQLDLAHVSLMYQPEQRLVGVLTAASRDGVTPASAEMVQPLVDAVAVRGSVADPVVDDLGARQVFDRTSLTLTIYLPLSEQAGGDPAIWPNSPPIPLPGVVLPPEQPAAQRSTG